MKESLDATLGRFLGWALVAVTVAVTPLWSLDPINPVKMMLLSAFAFVLLAIVVVNRRQVMWAHFKVPGLVLLSFMVWQLVVLFVADGSITHQLFGDYGRNTGLITYLGFVVLMLAAMVASGALLLNRFLIISFVVGSASLVYGVVQAVGLDPFKWVNPYSPVFGFLGNPNFQSSLLGILGALVFAQLLMKKSFVGLRVFIVLYLLLTVYVIAKTNSQQGFLVLLVGVAIILGIFARATFGRVLNLSYWAAFLFGFVGVLLGTLNKGPLAGLLYKESVTYRGDYWRAGWKMSLDNPIFGVGMDGYGDWYRRSRTIEATLRRGPEVTSNAAHNVYLDISSYGGFPLLFAYVVITVLVVIAAVKVIKRSTGFNSGFAGLVGAWVAFQAQSVISINQIGLAIWGWVLSGLIIGYEINTRGASDEVVAVKRSAGKSKVSKSAATAVKTSPATSVAIFVGLIIGVLVGMPPYLASARYKSALESGDPKVIAQAAYLWPLEAARMNQVALTLNENKLVSEALAVATDAVKKFPNDFQAWKSLATMASATEQQRAQALAQMKRLDPLNPDLK